MANLLGLTAIAVPAGTRPDGLPFKVQLLAPAFAADTALGALLTTIAEPLRLGPLTLDDGSTVLGFIADSACADPARDITGHGGWRSYLAASVH